MLFENREDSCPYSYISKMCNFTSSEESEQTDNEDEDSYNTEERHENSLRIKFYTDRKQTAYDKIVNSGEANLFVYDNKTLTIPKNNIYETAFNEYQKLSLFNDIFIYSVVKPKELLESRYNCLLGDNFKNSMDLIEPYIKGYYNSTKSEIEIKFNSKIPIELDDTLMYNCIVCSETRSIGHYTCYDHLVNENIEYTNYINKLDYEYNTLIDNIKLLSTLVVPKSFVVKFTEKSIDYSVYFYQK